MLTKVIGKETRGKEVAVSPARTFDTFAVFLSDSDLHELTQFDYTGSSEVDCT
jgi:hypothetical protein